jgi:putative membrane protein
MKILISILFNALILFLLTYLLGANDSGTVKEWIVVVWWFKTYLIWWVILWLINFTIRPILKILAIPLFFVFLWLVSFIINWAILLLFDYIINKILIMPGISYTITWQGLDWWINFIIIVAIFTILNMFYSLLISKK